MGVDGVVECRDLGVAISRNRVRIRVERVGWVVDAGEPIVVQVVEPFVVAADAGVENRDGHTGSDESEIIPHIIDSHRRDSLVHVWLSEAEILDHHQAAQGQQSCWLLQQFEGNSRSDCIEIMSSQCNFDA